MLKLFLLKLEDDDEDNMSVLHTSSTEGDPQLREKVHLQSLVQKAKLPLREIQKTLEANEMDMQQIGDETETAKRSINEGILDGELLFVN